MFWNVSEDVISEITADKCNKNGSLPGNTKANADEFYRQKMRCPDLPSQLANLDTGSTERTKSNHQLAKDRMQLRWHSQSAVMLERFDTHTRLPVLRGNSSGQDVKMLEWSMREHPAVTRLKPQLQTNPPSELPSDTNINVGYASKQAWTRKKDDRKQGIVVLRRSVGPLL